MKILLDHSAPKGVSGFLTGHEVRHTSEPGWDEASNGNLLRLAETKDFQLMITADKNLPWQQTLEGRRLGILSAGTDPEL